MINIYVICIVYVSMCKDKYRFFLALFRRSVWKKVFCAFTCCGRCTYSEDNGLVADEDILTSIQPIQKRLPYLGPIQDDSHMTPRKMKTPSSPLLRFLKEDEKTRVMPSTKSSSLVDDNQTTDIESLREESSSNTTPTRVERKRHHNQATIRDAHHLNHYHNDEMPISRGKSVSPIIAAAVHHTTCEKTVSIGTGHIGVDNSLCSDSFIRTGCVSRRRGEDDVLPEVNIISFNETTFPSSTMNRHRPSSDVTIQRHIFQPVQCQELVRSAAISRSAPPTVRDIQFFPMYHGRLALGTLDIHDSFKPSQKSQIISSCTLLSPSSHRSRPIPTYHSYLRITSADFNRGNFSDNIKSTKNECFTFSRDILINQSSSSALRVIGNKECIPSTPVHMKATFSCQTLSVTIPSSEGNFPKCQSDPTKVHFCHFFLQLSPRQRCSSAIVSSMTWNGIDKWSQSSTPNRHPLLSVRIVKPRLMVSKSLSVPVDVPAINVPSSQSDIVCHSLIDSAPSNALSREVSLFYKNAKTISSIRSFPCDQIAVEIRVNQDADSANEQVLELPSCSADNVKHAEQLAHLQQLSKEVQHSSEIQMVHTKSVATNRPLDTTIPDIGCNLTILRTLHSHLPVNHPTPGKNAAIQSATPTALDCTSKQPMIPSPAVVTTNGSPGWNKTKTRKAAIDNHNVQLPLLGRSLVAAWNFVTNSWYSNLFFQGALDNANGGQPIILPPKLPWQLIAPIPFNQKPQTPGLIFSPCHAQNNNVVSFQNIQDHAMQR